MEYRSIVTTRIVSNHIEIANAISNNLLFFSINLDTRDFLEFVTNMFLFRHIQQVVSYVTKLFCNIQIKFALGTYTEKRVQMDSFQKKSILFYLFYYIIGLHT